MDYLEKQRKLYFDFVKTFIVEYSNLSELSKNSKEIDDVKIIKK